ncbi:MAG: peptidoglycan DD-metalloendopeptidase family protein [Firmicutes bacterium]|nr:peptidoglycan DD-metalloendopeptidase family protein [Bacillota bacterium]
MKINEKIVTQTVICLMIFAGIRSVSMLDTDHINKAEKFFSENIKKNYSFNELKSKATNILSQAAGMQETMTSAVIRANTLNTVDNPLGEEEKGMQVVYAASGGDVISVGISEELGLHIKILSEEAAYTYGNMENIFAVPGERVRKGDIIGTYSTNNEKNFIFEID